MLVSDIMQAALAHCYEEADKDILTRNLTVTLVNLGIAELTDAENMYRRNDPAFVEDDTASPAAARVVHALTEPVTVSKPEDNVPYDWHITRILLPLWLAWKVYEGLDEPNRADAYRAMYEQRRAEIVPAVWAQMEDNSWGW